MRKSILMISALMMLMACGGKKAQADNTDATAVVVDSDGKEEESNMMEEMRSYLDEPQEEVQELTFASMAGIYDDEKQESRFCLNEDGTATWGMIGSLNYTEYTYTINGNTICLKPKGVETEDDCYDYDEDTRTLKNEQGAVYYRQVVE
ncbi:MAG: hypothetical protein IKP33_05270 [Prevotella sp.]|nr:hypothetical protein [Prevotella sp.]